MGNFVLELKEVILVDLRKSFDEYILANEGISVYRLSIYIFLLLYLL